MAKAKERPRAASPFRGVDLLDQTYGYIITPVSCERCACGAQVHVMRGEVSVFFCQSEECQRKAASIEFLERDGTLRDELAPHVRSYKGNDYEFFANQWWIMSKLSRSHPVHDSFLIRELDHRSGRKSKRAPRPVAKLQPPRHYSSTSEPAQKKKKKSCWCAPLSAHGQVPDEDLVRNCPAHGHTCKACGEDHSVAATADDALPLVDDDQEDTTNGSS